ncbi:MAG: chromosome segregation protein SMC, partial [Candidatus Anammoxibacter sp.]
QRDDLCKSEKSLNDIIEKLNHTSRELFEKTFNEIREHFYTYFRKLFGGGKADIILEDGVDILDAGIDIVVQPPNKEFKSLALFSGGEKVMITVALLFAILKTKPTPFCLMDEIDAALDENNIGRFTTVLKEFAIDSQFIIISHNKKTMNIADVIYGVTMEEPGVSKKVAVKFDGFE